VHDDRLGLLLREPTAGKQGRFTLLGKLSANEDPSVEGSVEVEGASSDLSHVLLSVAAEPHQLWPGDATAPGAASLYEYRDNSGHEPALVGVRNAGAPPWEAGATHINEGAQLISSCGTEYNAVSANGERVYFTAKACPGGPATNEIYVRVNGEHTVGVSEPSKQDCAECDTSETAQEQAPEGASFAGGSVDGTKILFATRQPLLKGASGNGLYQYDSGAPEGQRVKLITPDLAAVTATAVDETRVYFQTETVLQPAARNGNGEQAAAGQPNIYVYDTQSGQLSFVGQDAGGNPHVTADGRYLVFESTRRYPDTNNTSSVNQLFEYDAETGLITRVSIGQRSPGVTYECPTTGHPEAGYDCDGNTDNTNDEPKVTETGTAEKVVGVLKGLTVAEDGTVAFTSPLPLTPGAVQGQPIINESHQSENVYEYHDGNVYLISPADEENPLELVLDHSRLLGIDPSGRDIYFMSTDSLVPQDTDTQSSWYDARIGGGFPAPASPLGCSGSTCQRAAPTPPALPAQGGSETARPGENVLALAAPATSAKPKPPAKCKRGYVRKAGRCVKKKTRKATRASRKGRATR
jgi:hypothetical protein